jgi:hypothetical protein
MLQKIYPIIYPALVGLACEGVRVNFISRAPDRKKALKGILLSDRENFENARR